MRGRDPLPCQKPAIALANEIVYAKKQRKTPSPPRFNILNLFERQAGLLEITKGTSISKGLAKFAAQIYAQRNRVCHSFDYAGNCWQLRGLLEGQVDISHTFGTIQARYFSSAYFRPSTTIDRPANTALGTKEIPQMTMSVPLLRDPEYPYGIPLWVDADLPKAKRDITTMAGKSTISYSSKSASNKRNLRI